MPLPWRFGIAGYYKLTSGHRRRFMENGGGRAKANLVMPKSLGFDRYRLQEPTRPVDFTRIK